MLKSYYWILHVVMISTGAYFLADIASLAIGAHLEDLLERPIRSSGISGSVTAIKEEEDQHDYRPIIHRNIFNSRKKINPIPITGSSSGSIPIDLGSVPVSLPPLNLSLVGTVVAKGFTPFAVIRDPAKKGQTIYRQGDFVAMTAKIVEINRNKVTVLRDGKKVILELTLDPKKTAGRAKRVARRVTPTQLSKSDAEGTIRQVSENQWILDRRELDNAMKNLPQLLTKARIIPNFKEGKPDGFRIFAIARNSLYANIGLQNGDILHRINGVDVKDPQNFMKVMEQLKEESSININLVRNNQQQTFNYEIR